MRGGRIREVGSWNFVSKGFQGQVVDLGEVVVTPGLVNSHCHLDYTAMEGLISPRRSFSEWIQAIMALKANWRFSEFADSWLLGAKSSMASGTTTILDFEAIPELLPWIKKDLGLRVVSLLEVTNVSNPDLASNVLRATLDLRSRCLSEGEEGTVGIAPHAPYSTKADLLQVWSERLPDVPVCSSIHVAESSEEYEMFKNARGGMFDWLGKFHSGLREESPVAYLKRNGLLRSEMVLVHVNYVDDQDVSMIASAGSSVVHCPEVIYFGHRPFPLERFLERG